MKLISNKFQHNLSFSNYSLNENSCFLDIETLGLNRNKDMIYLVGLLYFSLEENLWYLDQYFAENQQDEKAMLLELTQSVRKFSTIITYNGNAFDIPYINNRIKIYDINYQISKDNSFDLYAIVKKNKHYLKLENYKLKTLERSIGIYREDIYSGKDCIDFYKTYLLNRDSILKKNILKHNYEDLFYMLDLFKIIDIIKDKKTLSLKFDNDCINIIMEALKVDGDYLIISGLIESKLKHIINYYESNYNFIIQDNNEFIITLEVEKGLISPEEICLFIKNKQFDINIYDESKYNAPNGIILLKVENNFIINNIKNTIESLFTKILLIK